MRGKRNLVGWSCLLDRSRVYNKTQFWNGYRHAIKSITDAFQLDLWSGQDKQVIVLVEKDALIGVIEPVCWRWRVDYMATRGFISIPGDIEIKENCRSDNVVIIYLGDHDPSGLCCVSDIKRRFTNEFVNTKVIHLGLTLEQVKEYDLPHNTAKESDVRYKEYSKKYGNQSWELDALDPKEIQAILEDEIKTHVDSEKFENMRFLEDKERERLIELTK